MQNKNRNILKRLVLILTLALLVVAPATAQSLEEFEETVTEFTLANGMHFILVERHEVPIVAFHLYMDVGGVDENIGQTGVAHLFEHMAFKGTRTIGTKNYQQEKKALGKVDVAYEALEAERAKGDRADSARLEQLEEAFRKAQEEAASFVVANGYFQIVQRAGGVGIHASTSSDATRYYLSLPSNNLELWFVLESLRFLEPVVREFYKERGVVMEERRMRTESQPFGKLIEEFLAIAYKAHPYGQPVVGHRSEVTRLRRSEAQEFFRKHYVASAMTAVIVGDADPQQVRRLAKTYFGRLPKRPRPELVRTEEPPQEGERRVMVEVASQPYVLAGYHRPSVRHPDSATLDVISDVLGGGRTSWLHKSLVKEKKIAVTAQAFTGFPGYKYPGLFIFFAVPSAGHTAEEVEKAMDEQIERIKEEEVPPERLEQVKRRARAAVLRGLRSNSGLASALAMNHVLLGDWRYLFRDLEAIEKVTAKDVQRAANQYFQRKNRTVGVILPPSPAAPAAKSD